MSETSTSDSVMLIRDLQTRLRETTEESIKRKNRLNAQSKQLAAMEKQIAEFDTLKASHEQQIQALTTERDAFRVRAEATPGEQAAKVKELESRLRAVDVERKFADLKSQLAEGTAVETIYKLTDFDPKAEGSEKVDPAELIAKAKAIAPRLFADSAASTAEAPPGGGKRTSLSVETPSGRGALDKTSRMRVARSELSDAAWMYQNQSRLAEAYANGGVDIVDG